MNTPLYLNWQNLTTIDTQELLAWARNQTLLSENFNNKPTGRCERWWGNGVELLNYGKSWHIYKANPIENEPLLKELRDRFYPQANSVLLYFYPPGIGIGDHTDKPVFNSNVVIVNLVDAQPNLFGEKPKIKFRLGRTIKLLGDGEVIRFNALISHGLPPLKVPRYSISLRIVADQ